MKILFWSKGEPEFRFLSNFWSSDLEFEGNFYASAEHAYQATKALDEDRRAYVANAKTAREAKKRASGMAPLDWPEKKDVVMLEVSRAKFVDPRLREMLLLTEGHELVHWSPWDTYWGVDREGKGENRLGKILMRVRGELRG